MQPLKQDAIDAIATLPDDVGIDEIMYRLHVLDKVRKGREDVVNGNVISVEELQREIKKW